MKREKQSDIFAQKPEQLFVWGTSNFERWSANVGLATTVTQKLNTNLFFSNSSGTPGISRQNPGISRPKSLISLVSRDISNFLAPPVHVEDPYPTGKYPDQKVWVWVPFSSLKQH